MDNLDSLLRNIETVINEISTSIKVDFGNHELMREQLNLINSYQDKLEQIQIDINEIIRATEVKKNDISIIAGIVGGLLFLLGGSVSEFGLNLAGEAANSRNSKEDEIKNIRQKCVSLQEKIESIISYIENIKYVAHQSLSDPNLMKFLYKKMLVKNMTTAFFNSLSLLSLIAVLITVITSLVLFFRAEFKSSFIVLLCGGFMFLVTGFFYNFVENANKKWQSLIQEIAETI